ncbi:MAG: hypothetical protein JW844_01740 [Candidatus Omnitrophica bacterium]|nr:hypothetical protein [Candidatus Omnitrophota bacterium]
MKYARVSFMLVVMGGMLYLTILSFNEPYKQYGEEDAAVVDSPQKVIPKARIDVTAEGALFELLDLEAYGVSGIILEREPNQPAEPRFAIVKQPASADWKAMIISFTPSDSGYLRIRLRGAYYDDIERNHHSVVFDDVAVCSEDLVRNGSFETEENGKPSDWEGDCEAYINDTARARTGDRAVQVWHDQFIDQVIPVAEKKTYMIKAYFKTADETNHN